MKSHRLFTWLTVCTLLFATGGPALRAEQNKKEDPNAKAEADTIGNAQVKESEAAAHTSHPDAQWFGDAGLGLFLHWGISSVKAMNISWPMIPGRPLANRRIDDQAERERIIREGDWNLNGKPNAITPNEYWEMAKDFNPADYQPDKWL